MVKCLDHASMTSLSARRNAGSGCAYTFSLRKATPPPALFVLPIATKRQCLEVNPDVLAHVAPIFSDAHHHPLVEVVRQVEHYDRRTSCGCAPDDAQTDGIPDKVIRPLLAARIKKWDAYLCLWITAFDAMAAPFTAVATGSGQVVGVL
jgi:hypothetical protein